MNTLYVPKKGDILWLNFPRSEQMGSEIIGYRPALVLTFSLFNKSSLAMICPITTNLRIDLPKNARVEVNAKITDPAAQKRLFMFENGEKRTHITGCLIPEQVTTVDWVARSPDRVPLVCSTIESNALTRVLEIVKAILSTPEIDASNYIL
ncbi:MAG: type II toxin-antitoxin system PemK/MazF family toxin [Burkholderiales bacterium]|jgi:mRNA-degrading endonuclease toxin of MazEF toxin-antitoxin module|nr:type II toxin-antitoxin system PemK/MazF family toxin [Burkholderiales bacterium]